MADKDKKKLNPRSLLLTFSGGVFGIYLIAIFSSSLLFAGTFGPETYIGKVEIGNLNRGQAVEKISSDWENYSKEQINIAGERLAISNVVNSIDVPGSIDEALAKQGNNYFDFAVWREQRFPIKVSLNDKAVYELLSKKYDSVQRLPLDANVDIENGETTTEKSGQTLLLAESRQNILDALSKMENTATLKIVETSPEITRNDALGLVERAKSAATEDINIASKAGNFTIKREILKSWLKISHAKEKSLVAQEEAVPLSDVDYYFYDKTKVEKWLSELAGKINKPAVNAQLQISDGKATVFTPSQAGYQLDTDDLYGKIQNAAVSSKAITAEVAVTEPDVTESSLNDLGINELISTGWTDFRGSPRNRMHNLTVGASKFNGFLIKPGENFSFNQTLGPVDASTGYLPELVILENKTVPQYGGGMCQVSSTAFRAALNAGLPILERTYHAYPVSYYKPYGVDATIYLPKPDLVFKNDTGHYILIQTRIEGTHLYFDFYGTKLNRTVKFSGNENANGAVDVVEKITPYLYDFGARGSGSFTAVFYRHIYDASGILTDNDKFTSKYDSPNKYPH